MQSRGLWAAKVGCVVALGGLFLFTDSPTAAGKGPSADARAAVADRLRRDVTFLASDECQGRGITTKGIHLAADYIAEKFKKAGLQPGLADGSYFQPFTIQGPGKLERPNRLQLVGPDGKKLDLRCGEDFQVMGLSGSAKVTAPVVFVGYGATATTIPYDEYRRVPVAGKVVVIIRKAPRFEDEKHPFDGDLAEHHAALVTKIVNADLHKAAAVLFVNDRDLPNGRDQLMSFDYTAQSGGAAGSPAVHVRRRVVNQMLRSSLHTTLSEIEKDIDRDLRPRSAALSGWTATVEVHVRRQAVAAKNIIGVSEGAGPLVGQTVVVGAHYDHLGYGGSGSLATDPSRKQIHHGADDNASGVAVLMELARRFGALPRRQGRRLVFIAFSGEESGLLGSEYYCKHPLFPLADTAAMVNLDMVGRLHREGGAWEVLHIFGTGTSPGFSALIDLLNQKSHFRLDKIPGGLGPSDHSSFYSSKIPVFFFFTGSHKDYHKPSDTADKINVPGMARVADMVESLVGHLATTSDRPRYVAVRGKFSPPGRGSRSYGPTLGIMPGNYNDTAEGVLVGGLRENGPAEKAGLKEGDRIIELAGKPVKNIQVYMVIMKTQKKGKTIDVGILRRGKKLVLKVTPQ